MMRYCFWYGTSKSSDLDWLGNAVRLLKENKWDGPTPLYFDGRGWVEKVREEAAISLLTALRTNTSVKSLYLRQAVLDVKAESALSQVFEINEHLERIVLRDIETIYGVLDPPGCLFKNPSLKEFAFTKGLLGQASLGALSNALRDPNSCMRHLSLENVVLDGCFKDFAHGVKQSKTLCQLSFRNMRLQDEEIALLLKAIGDNQSIVSLHLEKMNLGTSHAHMIAEMLKKNTSLQEVSLRSNVIDGESTRTILNKGACFNQTLRSLLLTQNHIGDEGAKAVTAFLQSNTSLETLCLAECKIGDIGSRTTAEGLCSMKGIRQLFMDSNEIQNSASIILASLRKGNYSVTSILQRLPSLLCSKHLDVCQITIWEQIEMHLRWNKFGRKVLRQEQEALLLANVLENVNTQPDLLYSFLKDSSVIC